VGDKSDHRHSHDFMELANARQSNVPLDCELGFPALETIVFPVTLGELVREVADVREELIAAEGFRSERERKDASIEVVPKIIPMLIVALSSPHATDMEMRRTSTIHVHDLR
jgi:hypothetical protein